LEVHLYLNRLAKHANKDIYHGKEEKIGQISQIYHLPGGYRAGKRGGDHAVFQNGSDKK
jgi:hypothetical protein